MRYWYIEGADGRHYCWQKEPTFTCPVGSAERLHDVLAAAAQVCRVDPEWLSRRMKHSPVRRRANGRLTTICDHCGHSLDRIGFAFWVEQPKADPDEATVRISNRLGLGPAAQHVTKTRYADTKRGAEEWAREQVKLSREIREEEASGLRS